MKLKSLLPSRQHQAAVTDPFTSLQREIDRLFSDFSTKLPMTNGVDLVPSIDVTETDKEIEITAELPGLDEKDVEISLEDGALSLRGEKRTEHEDSDRRYSERFYGRFERRVALPSEVDEDRAKATFKNGVLTVTLPKTERARQNVKRISISH